jgi:hypothetical protein
MCKGSSWSNCHFPTIVKPKCEQRFFFFFFLVTIFKTRMLNIHVMHNSMYQNLFDRHDHVLKLRPPSLFLIVYLGLFIQEYWD